MPNLVLASGSPRRRALVALLGRPFEVEPAAVDETPRPDEGPAAYALRLAAAKAAAVASGRSEGLVIGADTVVVHADRVLGKPRDAAEARAFLRRLRGGWHRVGTAVVVVDAATDARARGMAWTAVRLGSFRARQVIRPATEGVDAPARGSDSTSA